MHAAIAVPGNSRTILTHLFGRGFKDDRYVVERAAFQAAARAMQRSRLQVRNPRAAARTLPPSP